MLAAPAMATTDSGGYGKHVLDCFGSLFGDPKDHQDKCGPFNQPPFWFPTGGSGPGACPQVGELSPSLYGSALNRSDEFLLVARAPCGGVCSSMEFGPQPWQVPDLLEGLGNRQRILVATPCI